MTTPARVGRLSPPAQSVQDAFTEQLIALQDLPPREVVAVASWVASNLVIQLGAVQGEARAASNALAEILAHCEQGIEVLRPQRVANGT